MPFASKKQMRWMFSNKPSLAKKWKKKYGTKIRQPTKKRR